MTALKRDDVIKKSRDLDLVFFEKSYVVPNSCKVS